MMTAMFRAALVAAIATASIPTISAGQNLSADGLLRRIDSLQRRTDDLERRVARLEALPQASPTQGRAAAVGTPDVANWRQLVRGMTMADVRALLGDPERVDGGTFTVWHYKGAGEYSRGQVTFLQERLHDWSEP